VLAALVAYITVKTRLRGRGLLDGLATVPIAVPSVVMGVGILYWYLAAPLPFHLYGTLAILVVAFVTITLPYGMRYIVPGMAQIKDALGGGGRRPAGPAGGSRSGGCSCRCSCRRCWPRSSSR
jgi:ABC-type Fe3+ transport system, permease component